MDLSAEVTMGTRETFIHTFIQFMDCLRCYALCFDDGLCKCSEHKPKRLRLKTEHKTSTGASLSDSASLQQASVFLLYIKEKDGWEVKEGGQRKNDEEQKKPKKCQKNYHKMREIDLKKRSGWRKRWGVGGGGGRGEWMSVKAEGRERVKSILIPLIHTSAVLPTGVFTCTHTTHTLVQNAGQIYCCLLCS